MSNIVDIIKVIAGAVYVLYLPGYLLSFAFLKRGAIDGIERIAIAFALSISVVPLAVFYGYMLGIAITTRSVVLEILGILTLTFLYLLICNIYVKPKHPRHAQDT